MAVGLGELVALGTHDLYALSTSTERAVCVKHAKHTMVLALCCTALSRDRNQHTVFMVVWVRPMLGKW